MSLEKNNSAVTAVAMSGGVDSSTVAAILREAGQPIVGLTMQLWNQRRIQQNPATSRYELLRARDAAKDQSYFLFGLTQEQMARTVFPLGELTKEEVRAIARRAALPVAEKPESQEICFVPSGNYVRFIQAYLEERGSTLPAEDGEIVATNGEVIGRHQGVHRYTVGQRRGLGVAAGRRVLLRPARPRRRLDLLVAFQLNEGWTFRSDNRCWSSRGF